MHAPQGLPVVVIVGRPNVGKSTLFNAITRTRRAIVGDEPGITRDRIRGEAKFRGRPFELIDTGGIVPNDEDLIPSEIFRQARVALEEASHVLFLVDGRAEITAADRELAQLLRQLGKPVTLVVNKIDAPVRETLTHEFYSLGLGDPFPVSAEHRLGLDDLLDHVTRDFAVSVGEEQGPETRIKVAIIGRPNVGKSTLLNALVGQERAIVSPIAGTTRDAVDESIKKGQTTYTFVDTAGIRRKGKTRFMAEKLSVVMARRHIRMANVAILVLDASEGVVNLDATIAGYALEDGRAIVICVNKWDIAKEPSRKQFLQHVRDELKFLEFAPVAFVSAKTGRGVNQLFPLVYRAYQCASQRVPTAELNRFVESLNLDTDVKLKYITQASVRPPTFVAFLGGGEKELHFSTERFLINRLREKFGFEATPIVLRTRPSSKPRS
ncbi:MAG: ribosome biogenesis GTPase Der [Bryobacteraceae bacterium]|nr:ribosome biogenesis GTPase Der [Bryobacteraceae bacterium]MDW8377360.1 ribosome biogenesis GTPase Der [Bryobacterales bacterium]